MSQLPLHFVYSGTAKQSLSPSLLRHESLRALHSSMRSLCGSPFQTSAVAAGGMKGFLVIALGPCGCACAEGSAGCRVSPVILGLCPSLLQHLWERVVVSCLSAPWFLSKRNQSTQGDGVLLCPRMELSCTTSRSAFYLDITLSLCCPAALWLLGSLAATLDTKASWCVTWPLWTCWSLSTLY